MSYLVQRFCFRCRKTLTSIFAIAYLSAAIADAAEHLPGRVLFIGIDGCRFDAVEKARTPNLDRLIAAGCYSDETLILGQRYRRSDTVSGPGWSSLLTGVWADKHGVDSNRFENPQFENYPHFFRRVKTDYPRAVTISIAAWPPIARQIVTAADLNSQPTEIDRYIPGDQETATIATDVLRRGDPAVIFAYFGQVDEHGHAHGFAPNVPQYVAAIERVDGHIGKMLDALEVRPNYESENWLVIVSSDHGGIGKGHGNGRETTEVVRSFLIVSGAAAERGKLPGPTHIVDAPVTALVHMGVNIEARWNLDGRPIGLKRKR